MVSYDEDAELMRYVLRYHWDSLSPFEQQIQQAAYTREKFAGSSGAHATRMMERYGRLNDPKVAAALADGLDAFLRSACRRILAGQAAPEVNRCPRCRRVLRTPAAMQCFWCGLDWHLGGA